MKNIRQVLCLKLIILFSFNSYSQEDAVLMTVNNNAVYKSEFEQIYWKNKKELLATKEDLNEYIELFKNFKLKVTAAEELGLDTLTKFINELEKVIHFALESEPPFTYLEPIETSYMFK